MAGTSGSGGGCCEQDYPVWMPTVTTTDRSWELAGPGQPITHLEEKAAGFRGGSANSDCVVTGTWLLPKCKLEYLKELIHVLFFN